MALLSDDQGFLDGFSGGGLPPGQFRYINGQWVWTALPTGSGTPSGAAPGGSPKPDPPLGPPTDLMTPPPGAGNLFGIPNWLRDALGITIAGAGLFKGGAKNNIPNPYTPPAAGGAGAPAAPYVGQQGLEGVLGMARGRSEQSEPLFKALMTMAQSGLPDYAKGQGNG